MIRSTSQILAPKTVLQAISQMELPGTRLQSLLGFGFSGSNRLRQSGRHFSYDVFNHTRRVANGRGPGQASSRTAPQKVAAVAGTFPRAAESIALLDEDLLNRRPIGGSSDELDAMGESYITRQEAYLAQRFANLIEFQTAAMLRGSYSYRLDGDELRHGFSGGEVNIDFSVPASHKGGLNMLGQGDLLPGDWDDVASDIPGQLQAINAAMVRKTGMGLAHVALTGLGWQNVVRNTQVQKMGGSAGPAFQTMERVGAGEFTAVLRAIPWITFHVVDYGLEIFDGTNESFTKLIEDDRAVFLPEPSPRWCQYLEGSEIVTEGPNGPKHEQFGFYAYSYATHDPSGWELSAVLNGMPALYTPEAIAYGKVA